MRSRDVPGADHKNWMWSRSCLFDLLFFASFAALLLLVDFGNKDDGQKRKLHAIGLLLQRGERGRRRQRRMEDRDGIGSGFGELGGYGRG